MKPNKKVIFFLGCRRIKLNAIIFCKCQNRVKLLHNYMSAYFIEAHDFALLPNSHECQKIKNFKQ